MRITFSFAMVYYFDPICTWKCNLYILRVLGLKHDLIYIGMHYEYLNQNMYLWVKVVFCHVKNTLIVICAHKKLSLIHI